ncbi:hypothetical protein [Actinoallomurus sp. CA-150999]|uniref:hypothetical protein n=1 Tax=Actinoallomurus sp. CA-150999 TaxID=3239887 RepID=UPI003D8A1C89
MATTLDDIAKAEDAVADAEQELREFRNNPKQWSGFESLTREGRKELNVFESAMDEGAQLQRRVEVAHQQLAAAKRAWMTGV